MEELENYKVWNNGTNNIKQKIMKRYENSSVFCRFSCTDKGVTQTNKNETKKVMDFLYKQKPIEEQGEKK